MSDRLVHRTQKDLDGETIVALCGDGADWSPRSSSDVIADIHDGEHAYHVPWPTGRTRVHVAEGPAGRYLRTDIDATVHNNLFDLDDC